MNELTEYIANEWYVVRHSGELPEVALHSSLHYLTEAEDGPKLFLTENHLRELQEAALARYVEIILRDLRLENISTSMYRGVKRSIINYRRYQQFCKRQGLKVTAGFSGEVAKALHDFLVGETRDVEQGLRESVINCSFRELQCFALELGLLPETLPEGLASLCREGI